MTSKILFEDVIEAVRDYAFKVNSTLAKQLTVLWIFAFHIVGSYDDADTLFKNVANSGEESYCSSFALDKGIIHAVNALTYVISRMWTEVFLILRRLWPVQVYFLGLTYTVRSKSRKADAAIRFWEEVILKVHLHDTHVNHAKTHQTEHHFHLSYLYLFQD